MNTTGWTLFLHLFAGRDATASGSAVVGQPSVAGTESATSTGYGFWLPPGGQ